MHSTASTLGSIVGGFINIILLSLIWEKLLLRRLISNNIILNLASVALAWIAAGILGGFGLAVDRTFTWSAFGLYLIPALVVAVLAFFRGYGKETRR
jgi:uncharacterized membrane protein